MSHYKQQTSKSHELFIGSDTDSRVYMELVLGHSAAKAARDQGCSSVNAEALAHARRAVRIAQENNRPDLEEKAQLGKAEFLLMMGRKGESLEVEILIAAKAEGMEIEKETDGNVLSVGGVPLDEVARRLGVVGRRRDALEAEIVVAAEAEGLAIEEREDGSIVSVGGVPMGEVTRRFMENEVGQEPSSCSGLVSQHNMGDGGDTAKKSGPRNNAGSSAPSDTVWNNDAIRGRRVRGVRGHLVTVTCTAPMLRRKPAFKPM